MQQPKQNVKEDCRQSHGAGEPAAKGGERMKFIRGQEDCSLELSKAQCYADFLADYLSSMPGACDGRIRAMLTENQFETVSWMLSDIGILISQVNEAIYGEVQA